MSGHNNNEILSLKNCSWSIIDHKTSDEMYGEILLPDIMCSLTPSKFGIHIDDHVGVSTLGRMLGVYYKDKDENLFNLWVLKNYGVQNSWMKLFTIPIGTKVHTIIPIYIYSDNEVLLCFVKEGLVRTECVYRVICGSFGLSDRMWPLDYHDIGAITIDENGLVYTESLIPPKLGY
ncbi:hypothetical protein P3S68_018986 [Capsicum galapagoense]